MRFSRDAQFTCVSAFELFLIWASLHFFQFGRFTDAFIPIASIKIAPHTDCIFLFYMTQSNHTPVETPNLMCFLDLNFSQLGVSLLYTDLGRLSTHTDCVDTIAYIYIIWASQPNQIPVSDFQFFGLLIMYCLILFNDSSFRIM